MLFPFSYAIAFVFRFIRCRCQSWVQVAVISDQRQEVRCVGKLKEINSLTLLKYSAIFLF